MDANEEKEILKTKIAGKHNPKTVYNYECILFIIIRCCKWIQNIFNKKEGGYRFD